jgi:hypothetical protein
VCLRVRVRVEYGLYVHTCVNVLAFNGLMSYIYNTRLCMRARSRRSGESFSLDLDGIPSAAVPQWCASVQANTALSKLTVRVSALALGDVHGIRAALRMNAGLTEI